MITVGEHVPLAPHTYFKIGGPARFFARVANSEELEEALRWARDHDVRFFVLGSGSNVLVADKGFDGLVIKMDLNGISFLQNEEEEAGLPAFTKVTAGEPAVALVRAEAGVSMARLASETIKHKLAGLEWAIGIPGGVGGSVRGNAGCYGSEIKDVLETAQVLDISPEGAVIRIFTNAECLFGYRNSVFKQHPELIIVSATLALRAGDPAKSQELLRQFSKTRAQTQDIGSQCAGCIFKNPKEGRSAGELIDSLALKGLRIGNAAVSGKHGNFILNLGGGTAEEVVMLVGVIKERVHRTHGIMLEEEIQYVGF